MVSLRCVLVLMCSALSSCVLEDLPLDGLDCPCAPGWTCNSDLKCVRGDVVCGRENVEPGSIDVSNLRVEWTTSNQVRLHWDVGDSRDVFSYEVDVASSAESLSGTGDYSITLDDNPELGRGFLPGSNGADVVDRTSARELDADEGYFFRVVVIDNDRGVSCTEVVAARTLPEARQSAVLFREEHPNPDADLLTQPACVERREDAAQSLEGSFHYAYPVTCLGGLAACPCTNDASCGDGQTCGGDGRCLPSDGESDFCYENVRLSRLAVDVEIPSSGVFANAFFEVGVAIDDSPAATWAELGVRTPAGVFGHGRETLVSDGTYHIYQVPLAAMGLSYEELGGVITEFRVGSEFADGGTVRVDEVYIRW